MPPLRQGAGQGGEMKALLETRMMGGEPPESFQVHLGRELIDSHVVAGRMEPLDDLYASEGYNDVFPKDLIDMPFSTKAIPGRCRLTSIAPMCSGIAPPSWKQSALLSRPATWDEFLYMADATQGTRHPGHRHCRRRRRWQRSRAGMTILVALMGPDDWRGLFDGSVGWDDERVTQALDILNRMWDYAQPDYLSITWGDINDLFVTDDGPAMMIRATGRTACFKSMGFSDYKWAPSPGTTGLFDMLSDSFGLPKGVNYRDNALNWLKVCGSQEGQDAFNPIKGSISARTDADVSVYDEYQLSAMEDWKSNTLVPSLQHGAAAKQSFLLDYDLALSTTCWPAEMWPQTQAMLVTAAEDAAFGA